MATQIGRQQDETLATCFSPSFCVRDCVPYLNEIIMKIRSTTIVRNETTDQQVKYTFNKFEKTPRKPFTYSHTRQTLANCSVVYYLWFVMTFTRTNECFSHDANFLVFFFSLSALNCEICFIFHSVENLLFSFSGHETKLEYVYLPCTCK